jgi:DNA-directed RNA polymerase II subunit RPB11
MRALADPSTHPCPHTTLQTLPNPPNRQLLRDKQVKFAGYIHPHPLLHKIEVRVQTVDRNVSTPMQALENALSDLNQEFTGLKSRFQVRRTRRRRRS